MGLLLIAAAAVGWWAWKTRDAQALRIGDVAAVLAALIGLRLFTRGAAWWLWFRRGDRQAPAMSREEAGRLLGVPRNASAEAVRAAHRRLVMRVHPDAGGSAGLAARINAARDVLLARR